MKIATPETAAPAGAGAGAGADPAAAAEPREQVIWLYEKQRKLYPRAVSGWFTSWRWVVVWATQLLFYGLPWLEWHGRQAVLFDLEARRFYLLGLVLYPQDFIFLTGLLVVSAYSLFLFTAVAGRLWCGYACPQTVYTEVFMWIERVFEGDRMARIRLDAAPWSAAKVLRKSGKQIIWVALGLWTGFTFVGYFTPIHTLARETTSFGLGPWEVFWILFYGLATYGNAGHLREQVCKYMCPYARFQSAMFDRDTLVIGYDTERGEPRGTRGRKTDLQAAKLGHCIDCGLCVQVCPTGIDIRNGLQYECIGCAACVDVCDGVMDKMQYPRGLVRYDTLAGMAGHLSATQELRRVLRPRVMIYGALLGLIVFGLALGLALRSPFKVDVVRDRGVLSRIVDDGFVENIYRLQVMNATEDAQRFRISVRGLPELRLMQAEPVSLAPAAARWVPVAVRLPPAQAATAGPGSHRIEFVIERLAPRVPEVPSPAPVARDGAIATMEPVLGRPLVEKSAFVVPR